MEGLPDANRPANSPAPCHLLRALSLAASSFALASSTFALASAATLAPASDSASGGSAAAALALAALRAAAALPRAACPAAALEGIHAPSRPPAGSCGWREVWNKSVRTCETSVGGRPGHVGHPWVVRGLEMSSSYRNLLSAMT